METDSITSIQANDFRKRIEQLENRIKSKQNKSKFYFTEEDDEILDSNSMELPSDPETWLTVSDRCTPGEQSRLENHTFESMSAIVPDDVSSVISQSRRSYDSRTYTRPKKRVAAGLPLSFATAQETQQDFRMDCTKSSYTNPFGPHLNFSTADDNSTMESSLGIIDIGNLTESQLGFSKMASMERQPSSSTPPPDVLNLTYEKNNSTLCIASDGPLNTTFTLQEAGDHSPPTRRNSKFAKNLLPEASPICLNSKLVRNVLPELSPMGYNSKFAKNQLSEPSLNSKFARNQSSEPPPMSYNSKLTKNQHPEPSPMTYNSKFGRNQSPEPSPMSYNSKFARNHLPDPSPISQNSKFVRSQSPEPSPICLNSKFSKKPLFESTPLAKNSRLAHRESIQPTNNHHYHSEGLVYDEEEEEMNGDMFSNTHYKDSDDLMNVSFPTMMQSSTSIKGDPSLDNTFQVNPNATIDKRRSSAGMERCSTTENVGNRHVDNCEANPNLTIEKRRVSGGLVRSLATDNPSFDNFEKVNPNLTVEKRRSSVGVGRCSTTENVGDPSLDNCETNPNLTVEKRRVSGGLVRSLATENPSLDNFEVNPNLTVEKRRVSGGQGGSSSTENVAVDNFEVNPNPTSARQVRSSSTENVVVNNLNAKYQESLKNSERTRAIRDRLAGPEDPQTHVPSKNLSQITPPQSEFLGEPISFSTPSREDHQKSVANFMNGCSDSSTECDSVPSPLSAEASVSPPSRAGSVPPPAAAAAPALDGTFCKSSDFSKKGAKLMEGGGSPLNSTFRKMPLSTTFCKSAEALNNGVGGGGGGAGSAESGPEEDGMSTASDSSFSSSSTHMRSVGEIQSIARLQEESLNLQNKTALRKIAWGGSDSGDGDLTKGNQTAFRKQPMSDDGNQSDYSERCSPSSERCSPTALNNNLRNVSRLSLKPLSSYSRTGGLSMQHARSVEQLPSGMSLARTKPTFGVKRPTVVSKPPPAHQQMPPMAQVAQSRLQAPNAPAAAAAAANKPSGIRPPTAIPRPVSRLPAPKIKTGLPRYNSKTSGQS